MAKDESNHLVAGSLRSFPYFSKKANDMWIRHCAVLDPLSNFRWARSCGNFGEPLEQLKKSTWTNLGKEKIGDEG